MPSGWGTLKLMYKIWSKNSKEIFALFGCSAKCALIKYVQYVHGRSSIMKEELQVVGKIGWRNLGNRNGCFLLLVTVCAFINLPLLMVTLNSNLWQVVSVRYCHWLIFPLPQGTPLTTTDKNYWLVFCLWRKIQTRLFPSQDAIANSFQDL